MNQLPRYALTLQPDNIVYLWCNRVRILAVSDGWTETFLTQQNKSRVHFRPSRRKPTKGFIHKLSELDTLSSLQKT